MRARASGKAVVPSSLANPMPATAIIFYFSTMHVDHLRGITRLIRRLTISVQAEHVMGLSIRWAIQVSGSTITGPTRLNSPMQPLISFKTIFSRIWAPLQTKKPRKATFGWLRFVAPKRLQFHLFLDPKIVLGSRVLVWWAFN
jgi:hypothetical protein